jgi:hypothetical protein
MHDLLKNDDAHAHWLPLQEINIASPEVKDLLNNAHLIADWVISLTGLRIDAYFSRAKRKKGGSSAISPRQDLITM